MHRNQKVILHYLLKVDTATLEDIYNNQPVSYFHNWKKYMSERMSKMVKAGFVVRVKKGVFKTATKFPIISNAKIEFMENESQQKLFNT